MRTLIALTLASLTLGTAAHAAETQIYNIDGCKDPTELTSVAATTQCLALVARDQEALVYTSRQNEERLAFCKPQVTPQKAEPPADLVIDPTIAATMARQAELETQAAEANAQHCALLKNEKAELAERGQELYDLERALSDREYALKFAPTKQELDRMAQECRALQTNPNSMGPDAQAMAKLACANDPKWVEAQRKQAIQRADTSRPVAPPEQKLRPTHLLRLGD